MTIEVYTPGAGPTRTFDARGTSGFDETFVMVPFSGPSGSGLVNVKDFGAKGDGVTNDTAAIAAAVASLGAAGGLVYFPPGVYLVDTLSFTTPLVLMGSGGRSEAPGGVSNAPTRLLGHLNAPIVEFLSVAGNPVGRFSVMRDIAVVGNGAGSSQVGIIVDNFGTLIENVEVTHCGGVGILLRSSVEANYINVAAIGNVGDGWLYEQTNSTATSPAIEANVFSNCEALSNGGHGFHWLSNVGENLSDNTYVCGNSEGNTGWGWYLESTNATGLMQFIRTYASHEESNTGGSVNFDPNATGGVQYNNFYLRLGTGEPHHGFAFDNNFVSAEDASGAVPYKGSRWQQKSILGGRYSAGDVDSVTIRSSDTTAPGRLALGQVLAYVGITNNFGDDAPADVQYSLNDAFKTVFGKGLSSGSSAGGGGANYVILLRVRNDGARDTCDLAFADGTGVAAPVRFANVSGSVPPGMWGGTGVPSNALGANGDYYFRTDGGAGTHIYFKSAGAWAGIV